MRKYIGGTIGMMAMMYAQMESGANKMIDQPFFKTRMHTKVKRQLTPKQKKARRKSKMQRLSRKFNKLR